MMLTQNITATMTTDREPQHIKYKNITPPIKKPRPSISNEDESTYEQSSKAYYLTTSVFNIVLEDWMHDFGKSLEADDYRLLLESITKLVHQSLPLTFFIPGFPCKSPNMAKKVLGYRPDFSEFLAIRSLLSTIRKLEALYPFGVKMIILSDYHTFDQCIGVKEENYKVYHSELKVMISNLGGADVIELISLSSFPEFHTTPEAEISAKLQLEFGGKYVLDTFDDAIKSDSSMLGKYKQLRKFLQSDQSHDLPGSPKSRLTQEFIKRIARGMMAQGVALDNFLKQQQKLTNYIRLSIHHHMPSSGKFAINLFKGTASSGAILRTPWHHVVLFDSLTGELIVDHKENTQNQAAPNSRLVTVTFEGKPWFLLRLYFNNVTLNHCETIPEFEVTMMRGSCGMLIECKTDQSSSAIPEASILEEGCLTSLIREFGLVVLRGFKKFEDESEITEFYRGRAKNGILKWKFGPVHKVTPKEDMPGYVNSYEGIPVHFDLLAPPKYMNISQREHEYSDFISREFLLFCKSIKTTDDNGGTTFVDARGVVLGLSGRKIKEWKETTLRYETKLRQASDKELYFGGEKNTYEYPVILQCPWTGHNVLRWLQSWTEKSHPTSSQYNWTVIQASPRGASQSAEEIEEDITRAALDERFFFTHSYREGDQVYVNNYTTLHGRNGFTNDRELWRLQAIPPSDNLPDYFMKNRVR